jgi:serine/threonine protein kinase
LFAQACHAIAHAHTKAIIHRDIKASNVLAYMHDGKATVKVIDFGVAKALTGDRLTDATFNTELGRIVGTYDSMSPEQAEGSPDIDTRTDVYSLGVLLYELLTGVKPFDQATLAKAADQEIRRIIREVEPPRPSTRLSSLGQSATKIAAARQANVEGLERDLRRELEWIPLKAMGKQRERRYVGPVQIVEDIQRYLAGQPLQAGPESRAYRVRKFLRRNRAAVLETAAVLLLAIAGLALYVHAIRAEQRKTQAALAEARQQKDIAQAVSDFQSDMLASADPGRLLGEKVTVLQAISAAARELDAGKLKDKPLVEATVRGTIGQTLTGLGRYDDAEAQHRKALQLRRGALPAGHPDIVMSLNNLAIALEEQGKLEQAEPLLREATAAASCPLETCTSEPVSTTSPSFS